MSFMTFLIKSQKKLYKPALFIFYVQILLVSLFYFHNKGHINKKLQPVIYNTFDSLYIQDYLRYFRDLILSFNFNNKIERIDIKLDFENIVGLDCTRKQELGCKNDPWLKGNLLEGENNYPIKIKSKTNNLNVIFSLKYIGPEKNIGIEHLKNYLTSNH